MKCPSFSLDNQTALVTGAARGIGQAIAIALAQAGADVIVAARDRSKLDETESLIAAVGGRSQSVTLDVCDNESIKTCFEKLSPRLNILVNNAGIEEVRESLDVDLILWDRILQTNLRGSFFCAQAAARRMITENGETHGGSILNLCSLTSEVGIPGAVPYGASKSGLQGMTRALAAEWGPMGIRVNGIGPGYFQTAMTAPFYADANWQERMRGKIPLGRFGRMEDLMGTAVFLCSDAAAYITGQVLYVDGGTLAAL
ncbi:SDR family NAD(P)-dependent oxidoreductase [Acidisoma silvae]|uniref:SDR family oxidoreductase n=1 Tax=Acidisoma silvae TaxID=2802396 RepID=A0A963YN71_9PROT|nr:glucose 1-dehydrogenase [Acidisoma silvae]MCB8873829.1 SDR family oxidoreductase [Acidisoma silvae]